MFRPRKLGHGRHVAPSIRKQDQPDEAGVDKLEEEGVTAVVVPLPSSSAKMATGVSRKRRKRRNIPR